MSLKKILIFLNLLPLAFFSCFLSANAEPIIIDHLCTDLTQISAEWIDTTQESIKGYYAHTSHGRQLTIGLETIEQTDSQYAVAIGDGYLPVENGSLCIFDSIGITPYGFWSSPGGRQTTQDILDANPTINFCMWSWCGELNEYTSQEVQEYLDAFQGFEQDNPDVFFIYMTGNAQTTGSEGYNRYLRNQQIRNWVLQSENRVLFDFAELDSWWFNPSTQQWEQATYNYGGIDIPVQHPEFNDLSGPGHTTEESCEQKGKAVWWMVATLAGWNSGSQENHAPVLNPIGAKNVYEEELLEFVVSAFDQDGDDIIYSADHLPAGSTFNPNTQVFSWMPELGLAGSYDVEFSVTDDGNSPLHDSEVVKITVRQDAGGSEDSDSDGGGGGGICFVRIASCTE